jgi:hypothetical protein
VSQLKAHEKAIFERLFDRGGYVLDFTDKTYSDFFREHRINIDDPKYRFNGQSKMKRLRAFWEIEPDLVVGRVLEGMLEYKTAIEVIDPSDQKRALEIICRLLGKNVDRETSEGEFLSKEFSAIDLSRLNIDTQFQSVIEQRLQEVQRCLQANAPLAAIFLCGSTLEGLLLDAAAKNAKSFNQHPSAPKDKHGTLKPFHEWSLDSLINTAHETGLISLDVKKYGHALRDFRNYIHPRQQAVQSFSPDQHTAKISWAVLQAAIANLAGLR